MAVLLHGDCAEGYESVKHLFQSHLASGKDENAQLCRFMLMVRELWTFGGRQLVTQIMALMTCR